MLPSARNAFIGLAAKKSTMWTGLIAASTPGFVTIWTRPTRPSTANHTTIVGPKIRPMAPVPRRCTAKSPTRMTQVTGVRAPRVRAHAPHVRLRVPPSRRRTGDVRRVLRTHRRRAPGVDDGGPEQGAGGGRGPEGQPLRPGRAMAVRLRPGVRTGNGRPQSRARRRRHDGGRCAHVGRAARPAVRPAVEAMAQAEDRVVLRCRPYSTFATPPRHLHSTDRADRLSHWVSGGVPWDVPDPPGPRAAPARGRHRARCEALQLAARVRGT